MKKNISIQSIELALVAPQVVAYRIARMSSMGLQPSIEDVVEFNRMWSEKALAASESWSEIALETLRYQRKVAESIAAYWITPWLLPGAVLGSSILHAPTASERIIRKGMSPIHHRAVKNAKRFNQAAGHHDSD